MMEDFIVLLKRALDSEIQETITAANCNIVFHDELVPDIVGIHGHQNVIESFEFVEGAQLARTGGNLLEKKKKLAEKTLVQMVPAINTEALQKIGHGFGVGVAVLDCGVDRDICGSVEVEEDFTNMGKEAAEPHGSIVVSIIKHFSKAARIFSAKVCHKDGDMKELNLLKAIQWARKQEGVKIINLSVGFERDCDGTCYLSKYINDVWAQTKILFVAAVGNNDKDGRQTQVHCPACASEAVTVGGVSRDGETKAHFNSKGHIHINKPNILTSGFGGIVSPVYFTPFQGSSFAAPVITGIMCTLVSYIGNMDKLRMRMYETASPLKNLASADQGFGVLDLPKLLEVLSNEKGIDSATS